VSADYADCPLAFLRAWVERGGEGMALAKLGKNVVIYKNVVFGENVSIHDNAIIYDNVSLGDNTVVGPGTIVGHPLTAFFRNDPKYVNPPTRIGKNCVIRANNTIYCGVVFADGVKTGTNAVIRERCSFGENTSVGTMVQVENDTVVGSNVSIETGSHVTAKAILEDDVFLGAHVVTTNDNKMLRPIDVQRGKTTVLKGPTIRRGAKIGSNATVLPAVEIGRNSIIAAGAVVTKNVPENSIVKGVPIRVTGSVPEEDRL
jgi:acetyltransferase-like isoleucine patch superfamily enzyme